jgi:hypothetical protein
MAGAHARSKLANLIFQLEVQGQLTVSGLPIISSAHIPILPLPIVRPAVLRVSSCRFRTVKIYSRA